VFKMMTEMNNLPAENCAYQSTLANTKAATKVATKATPTAKPAPIVLTPPPTSNTAQEDSVMIDPYTGEIIRDKKTSTASTAETATQGERTVLKGLFGTSSTSSQETTDTSKREMQEKMLWGNRPQIR